MAEHRPTYLRTVVTPAVIYFVAYVALTFPAIQHFNSDFLGDANDGLQTAWDVWWVAWAVRHAANPWFTHFLHYPQGTSLVAQTLHPFDGFVFGPLLRTGLTLTQTCNTMVIFGFVVGGVSAFWLSLELTRDYLGSLLCGYLFTFSDYHFAHAQGHFQLVALEWLPLFLFLWWRLLKLPSVARGVAAAASLFLVLLCDYYYFFFCVLAGVIVLTWSLLSRRSARPWAERSFLIGLGSFAAASLALCGPLLGSLLRLSARDPLLGAHDVNAFSLDLLAPFIPGGTWRFAEWTHWYWQRLPGNLSESSVAWGPCAIVLMIVAWKSRGMRPAWIGIWSFLLAFFAVMALGPKLRLLGRPLGGVPGPYALLAMLLPPLKLSGVPVRMMVMTTLCVALIAGFGFSLLWRRSGWPRALAILLVAGAVFESWPMAQTLTSNTFPPYVAAMRSLSKDYGLFDVDDAFGAANALIYQTVHEIPMVHGYITRVPASVAESDAELDTLAALGQWQMLCERYGIRYVVFKSKPTLDAALSGSRIFQGIDGDLRFYDIGRLWTCAKSPIGPIPHPELPLRWQTVARRAGAGNSGGLCLIDTINSRDPHQARRPIQLARSGTINVIGWGFQRESRQAPESVNLRLEGSDGTGYEAPARRLKRPDVAEAFQAPDLKMAGFQIFGSLASVPAGLYRVVVVQEDKSGRTFCDRGLKVALLESTESAPAFDAK